MSHRLWHGALHLSPLAGRGRRALVHRVRGPLRESELVERPPHPDPLPASGEREKKPLCHVQSPFPQEGGEKRRLRLTVSLCETTAAIFAVAVVAATAALAPWVASLGPAPLGHGLEFSATVVDRRGRLLRPYASSEGLWRFPP